MALPPKSPVCLPHSGPEDGEGNFLPWTQGLGASVSESEGLGPSKALLSHCLSIKQIMPPECPNYFVRVKSLVTVLVYEVVYVFMVLLTCSVTLIEILMSDCVCVCVSQSNKNR